MGNSTWALADDGELMSMGGDIGQAPPLHDVLSNNGIEPGQVKSIEFTKTTSAHDITDMLGNLPNLQKITKISNLHYSGNGDQMFRDNTVLESIDFKGFDTSQVTSMYGMFDNAGKLSSLNIKISTHVKLIAWALCLIMLSPMILMCLLSILVMLIIWKGCLMALL